MTPVVTPLYAGIAALLYLWLAKRVIARRGTVRVGLGDGGDAALQGLIRAHGNFAEYMPMALLLILLAEMQGAPGWALHLLGLALLAGRGLHVAALSRGALRLRVAGMALTFLVIALAALGNIAHALI